jgi:hypothetical protein
MPLTILGSFKHLLTNTWWQRQSFKKSENCERNHRTYSGPNDSGQPRFHRVGAFELIYRVHHRPRRSVLSFATSCMSALDHILEIGGSVLFLIAAMWVTAYAYGCVGGRLVGGYRWRPEFQCPLRWLGPLRRLIATICIRTPLARHSCAYRSA